MTKQEQEAYRKVYNMEHDLAFKQKQREYREANRERLLEQQRNYYLAVKDDPGFKYRTQAKKAKRRGVEFNLTFKEWRDLWSEHWDERGTGSDQFCMCRTNDEGAYEVGNVRIDTNLNNKLEHHAIKRSTA